MTEIFVTRKLDGSNKNIKCLKCKRRSRINSSQICYYCYGLNSLISSSGNIKIDCFIKGTQSPNNRSYDPHLIWVPFEEFKDIRKIGQGGFSQIFKATWKINEGIGDKGTVKWSKSEREIVLKVLNNSQYVDAEFLNELKHTFQFRDKLSYGCKEKIIIECYGVTRDPQTKNYAFVLEYIPNGDLYHFIQKNFEEFTWRIKIHYLYCIIMGIKKIHGWKIIHRDLHSGNILVSKNKILNDYPVISDLGFSQPANIDSNLSRESQIYGIIPYMAPELFKNQPYSYASDIYSLGMIMWELTSGHRPFHDQEHGPKLILDILDGKRPEITEDTPERGANLMKSGNILVSKNKILNDYPVISDLGFSQPANIDSNLSRESQIYGIIPYMAPELFKNQPYSYASDIYSLGMIMWELTSGHRPFHDQEHGPKLILDILDGKRPEITEDTPERGANLMKRCWHPDPSQRPTIKEIYDLLRKFRCYYRYYFRYKDVIKKYNPNEYDFWLEFNEAEKKRRKMIESKKPFVKNPGYEHPNSRYYSTSLNSMLESINSTITDLFSDNNLLSNDHFDIMNFNNFENSDHNSSAENSKKHFLNELSEEEIIEHQNDILWITHYSKVKIFVTGKLGKLDGSNKNIKCLKCKQHIFYYFYGLNSLISNKFKDVREIGQGGSCQIFKANWKINEGISDKDKVNRQKLEQEIVLKVLNNSQNVDTGFLNEDITIYALLLII
ncbi:hypothetical protein Glove_346g141 [Diversispora epigaea]|uniref:Protein kinase domain-containing protein n=1 Tax=Diversispora epigaea TaxID=1348612 RepID=A0A397HFL6_9GLOM|nr:hypothetical protein Glove_346g141 [Diversispora epigaea]